MTDHRFDEVGTQQDEIFRAIGEAQDALRELKKLVRSNGYAMQRRLDDVEYYLRRAEQEMMFEPVNGGDFDDE